MKDHPKDLPGHDESLNAKVAKLEKQMVGVLARLAALEATVFPPPKKLVPGDPGYA
jgi:hypothetical protein